MAKLLAFPSGSNSKQDPPKSERSIIRIWMDVEIPDEATDPTPALLRAAQQFTSEQTTPYGTFVPLGLKLRVLRENDKRLGFDKVATAAIGS